MNVFLFLLDASLRWFSRSLEFWTPKITNALLFYSLQDNVSKIKTQEKNSAAKQSRFWIINSRLIIVFFFSLIPLSTHVLFDTFSY